MKKLSIILMMFLALWSIQACNDSSRTDDADREAANSDTQASANVTDTVSIASSTPVSEEDSSFMVEAAGGGMMEVEAGNAAQQNAQDQRVKDFGAMMVRDHSAANDELKSLASRKNVTLPATLPEKHQKHVKDLNEKKGRNFDKAYMKMMVDDHEKDVNKFEKASNNAADPDLKAFATKTLPTLRAHLDSARAINKALKQ